MTARIISIHLFPNSMAVAIIIGSLVNMEITNGRNRNRTRLTLYNDIICSWINSRSILINTVSYMNWKSLSNNNNNNNNNNNDIICTWINSKSILINTVSYMNWKSLSNNNNNNNFYLYSAIKSNQSNCSVALYNE